MPNKTALDRNKQREEYIKCLKNAIADGIWLKTPRDPDQFGDGTKIKVSRPIACFTEWSLGQSLAHTSAYGRLGLGFSKRFILSRGGQPVIYVQDKRSNAPYAKALYALATALKNPAIKMATSEREKLWQHFEFIAHFAKVIQRPVNVGASSKRSSTKISSTKPGKDPLIEEAEKAEKAFVRIYGRILHYLEEREWRIVYDKTLRKYFEDCSSTHGGPDYLLPFEAGKELFTVVLPDNCTVNLAMRDAWLRNKFFPKNSPHVTLLSFEDIGTF